MDTEPQTPAFLSVLEVTDWMSMTHHLLRRETHRLAKQQIAYLLVKTGGQIN
jgi:hypothetical protein